MAADIAAARAVACRIYICDAIREEVDLELGIRCRVQHAGDSNFITGEVNCPEDRKVLKIVRTRVGIPVIVKRDSVIAEVDSQAAVLED